MSSRMPIVENFDGEVIVDDGDADGGTLGVGMTQDVGEALLDDAVRAVSGGRRNSCWYGIQLQVDVDTRVPYAVDELVQVGEGLGWSHRSFACGGANYLQRGAQLSQR